MTATIPVTAMVLTHNSAESIGPCLESLRGIGEVIVCDGNSTDGTGELAARLGARVISQDARFLDAHGRLQDYAGVRHQVVTAAREDWILHLDSDELATPELVEEIRVLTDGNARADAYWVPARHIVAGAEIASASNYPMRYLRLFRRDAVTDYSGPINERPVLSPAASYGSLTHEFLIPMPRFRTVLRKWARYQRIVFDNARTSGDPARDAIDPANRLRIAKWLTWRTWRSRRSEPPPHMPLRYEVGRVGFHLGQLLAATAGSVCRRSHVRRGR